MQWLWDSTLESKRLARGFWGCVFTCTGVGTHDVHAHQSQPCKPVMPHLRYWAAPGFSGDSTELSVSHAYGQCGEWGFDQCIFLCRRTSWVPKSSMALGRETIQLQTPPQGMKFMTNRDVMCKQCRVQFILPVDHAGLAPVHGSLTGQSVNGHWLGKGKSKVENICSWTSEAQPGTMWKARLAHRMLVKL